MSDESVSYPKGDNWIFSISLNDENYLRMNRAISKGNHYHCFHLSFSFLLRSQKRNDEKMNHRLIGRNERVVWVTFLNTCVKVHSLFLYVSRAENRRKFFPFCFFVNRNDEKKRKKERHVLYYTIYTPDEELVLFDHFQFTWSSQGSFSAVKHSIKGKEEQVRRLHL